MIGCEISMEERRVEEGVIEEIREDRGRDGGENRKGRSHSDKKETRRDGGGEMTERR